MTKTLTGTARFANSDVGYVRLAGFARRWEHPRWAVEGSRGAGRSLAQRLVADGETVLDVPAKLAARVRVYSQGQWAQDRPGRRGLHRAGRAGRQRSRPGGTR